MHVGYGFEHGRDVVSSTFTAQRIFSYIKSGLNVNGHAKRDGGISRHALQHLKTSLIFILYGYASDRFLTTLTGFDHVAFRSLIVSFGLLYNAYSPYSADGTVRILRNRAVSRRRPRLLTGGQFLCLLITCNRT